MQFDYTALKNQWLQEGVVVLRGVFDASQVAALRGDVDWFWDNPEAHHVMVDITSGPLANHRLKLCDVPVETRQHHHRLNDIYLESPGFRNSLLSGSMGELLGSLLDGPPLLMNSLFFNYGSENDPHVDTFVMPPVIDGKLAGMTIALEPYTMENGALFYYPKSHCFPPYIFSSGSEMSIESEKPKYLTQLHHLLDAANIEREYFIAEPGDVIIWSSRLVHGGLPIANPAATRESIVAHFWRAGDISHEGNYHWLYGLEKPCGFGAYLDRPHQLPMTHGGLL